MVDIISFPLSMVVKDAAPDEADPEPEAALPDAPAPEVLPQAARDRDIKAVRTNASNFFMILLFLFLNRISRRRAEAFGFYSGEALSGNLIYHIMFHIKCQYFFNKNE